MADEETFLTDVGYNCIEDEHLDVTFYKREDISLILSKGLAVTVREKPRNPIEYFSNWLLEYNNVQIKAKDAKNKAKELNKLKEEHSKVLDKEAKAAEEAQNIADQKAAANAQFWTDLEKSEDPYDNLEAFAQYIHNNIGSTGVYIG